MMPLDCPNCGDTVPRAIHHTVMVTCPSCATTLYLDGNRLAKAGRSGDMHDSPMLFGLGDSVRLGRTMATLHGHARFSYGRGWWDEFWITNGSGRGGWLSVDEGDIVLQFPLDRSRIPTRIGRARIGQMIRMDGQAWTVTELNDAECVALRGSFGEALTVGETYRFLNADGEDGSLLSAELWDGGEAWFLGDWFDPFAIRITRESPA